MPTKVKDLVLAAGTAVANSGSADIDLVFSDQPEADDTFTLGDTTFTFVASGASGDEINISGVNLAGTLDNILTVVNGSAEASVITATEDGTDTLTITYDTAGVGGNDYAVSWDFATTTIAADGGDAAIAGSDTLDGGNISLTNGFGSHAVELWSDGSLRFTTTGGQLVAIRDVQLNKLLKEIVLENELGVSEDYTFFGTP